jgi:hypothetical protein
VQEFNVFRDASWRKVGLAKGADPNFARETILQGLGDRRLRKRPVEGDQCGGEQNPSRQKSGADPNPPG